MQPLALAFLVTLAIGGLGWVFVYPLLSGERRVEQRRESVARATPARTVRTSGKSRRDQVEETLKVFERRIADVPEVMSCYLRTGEADYVLRIVVPDVAAYERFLKQALTRLEGVASIKSSFALKQVKYSTVLPLEAPGAASGTRARS